MELHERLSWNSVQDDVDDDDRSDDDDHGGGDDDKDKDEDADDDDDDYDWFEETHDLEKYRFVILVVQKHRTDISLFLSPSLSLYAYPRRASKLNLLHVSLFIVQYTEQNNLNNQRETLYCLVVDDSELPS